MAKTKWRARHFVPKQGQQGSASWFAEAVIDQEITNVELAQKIAARTGFKSYECQAVIAAIADIVMEECCESNRVTLADEKGQRLVSIQPKVTGTVSNLDIERETTARHAADPSVPVRTVAEESDLTADRLTWVLAATIGIKTSKQFGISKTAVKVKTTTQDVETDEQPSDDSGNTQQGGGNTGGGNTGGGSYEP